MNTIEKNILKDYANEITSRGFSVPAVFFFEMFKYLSLNINFPEGIA